MQAKLHAALGSALFFVLAPGVVGVALPWSLTGWELAEPLSAWAPLRVAGGLLIGAGGIALVHAFARFVTEGLGTPAPVAPTEELVIGGLYRHVRNPMYVAVAAVIIGQALVLWQLGLLIYAAAFGLTVGSFVHWYEEPVLAERFGHRYETYRRAVPGWRPRLRPWRPEEEGVGEGRS